MNLGANILHPRYGTGLNFTPGNTPSAAAVNRIRIFEAIWGVTSRK
jgi:hypothetical protein